MIRLHHRPLYALVLLSCGDSDPGALVAPVGPSERKVDLRGAEAIASEAMLGECNAESEGKVYFVSATGTFKYCREGAWTSVVENGSETMPAAGFATLVESTREAPGKNCRRGGSVVKLGRDFNRDGKLQPNEVTQSSFLCSEDGPINVKDFGAKGDNTHDDYDAIVAAFGVAAETKAPLYFPPGRYSVGTRPLRFPIDPIMSGLSIYGDGHGISVIDAKSVVGSPQVSFQCNSPSPCHSVHLNVRDLGFETDTPGTGLAIGSMNLDVQDNVNELRLDVAVYNHNTQDSAVAVTLNRLYNPKVRLIANVAGNGTALKLRQVSFGQFFGSYGAGVYRLPGDAYFRFLRGVSVRITDSFNNGNVFLAMDMENVAVCVVSDSPANQGNTFIGGTFAFKDFGVQSTAGSRLLVENPGVNPTEAPVTNLVDPSKSVGVTVYPSIPGVAGSP
jgi:hypothetical protein